MGIPSFVFTVYRQLVSPRKDGELSSLHSGDHISLIVTGLHLRRTHTRKNAHTHIHTHGLLTCSLTEARMAEVVSDSEPSPLEALRTGLNMVAALAVSDATSGTGIPPGKQGNMQVFYY